MGGGISAGACCCLRAPPPPCPPDTGTSVHVANLRQNVPHEPSGWALYCGGYTPFFPGERAPNSRGRQHTVLWPVVAQPKGGDGEALHNHATTTSVLGPVSPCPPTSSPPAPKRLLQSPLGVLKQAGHVLPKEVVKLAVKKVGRHVEGARGGHHHVHSAQDYGEGEPSVQVPAVPVWEVEQRERSHTQCRVG
jgi:hypothetical protein